MTEIGKKGQMIFAGIDPMKIIETDEEIPSVPRIEHQETVRAIAKTVRAYLEAGADLLGEKYRHLRELAPEHLADPGNTLVAYCNGGVVIRYEKKAESFRVFAASLPGDLATGALMLSQNLVRCHQPTEPNLAPEPTGIELKFSVGNPATSELKEVLSTKIWFDAVIKHPERRSQPPHKPFCLLSVRNSFELELLGELIPENAGTTQGQRFIARSILRLPVGWECIEVYPFLEPDEWKPEYARVWAENDILAAVASQQFREASFRSLDPNAEARRQYGALLKTFKTLLDSEPEREQVLQSFLQSNPALLCPTHTRMWPKLALGARETDFVFRDASQDYLLVELERSTHRLFRSDGHASADLNHARGQIGDWKRYLEDNLATVQRELGLTGISVNPRSLVVIGRSSSLTQENRRSLVSMENEHPKLRVMTYDDVYENAKAMIENLFGPVLETAGNTEIYYVR